MKPKWSFFAGSVVIAAYLLLAGGAPPMAILAGIALAAVLTARQKRIA